jgi:malate dehydrogenase (oxaloacetate-decarboxylating)(NADP+)
METGVARRPIKDFEAYKDCLEARLGKSREIMRFFIHKAQEVRKRIVFPEGTESKIIRASAIIAEEKIACPVLLGNRDIILKKFDELGLDFDEKQINIIDPELSPKFESYVQELFQLRQRKGVTYFDAERMTRTPDIFGMLMVRMGDADGLISGLTKHYPETVRPALQIIGKKETIRRIAGLYMMVFKTDTVFIADATVNIEPSVEDLVDITIQVADKVKQFNFTPKIAMLSFSNFGSTRHPLAEKVRLATEKIKELRPDLIIDGEMQADTSQNPDIINEFYPFSKLKEKANVLICPDLTSANISYKLLATLGGATAIGPILLGIKKPVYLLGYGSLVDDIVNITAMAVFEAENLL